MDEKENIIKYYRKTGESLTNLTGLSFDTRVGATANAFVLLKFLIKELLQLQLSHQKINYYSTLIRVTSLSCEKVHRTFSAKTKNSVPYETLLLFWTLVLAQPPTLSSY